MIALGSRVSRRDTGQVSGRRLVYSTEQGRVRSSPALRPSLPGDGVVRIFRERGGRGGKTVTVIRGLPERGTLLATRAVELKRLCGAGGTVKDDDAVEIQGDHRERVGDHLRALGYRVKLAGG
jgi:translation initiation factor 1